MLRFSQHQGRGVFALLTVVAVALSGCGGNAATTAPAASGTNGAGASGGAAASGSGGAASSSPQPSGIAGAASALAGLNSFKFTMTETGGTFGGTLSLLPQAASGNPTFKLSGTILLQPQPAADITVAQTLHVINVGGFDYQDLDLSGSFTKNDASNGSQADSLSPIAVFAATFGPTFDFAGGFDDKGSETKNGVAAEHYTANDSGQAALAELGSVAGVTADTWAADIWIAQDGGYPVSVSVTASVMATATSAAGVVFERSFDLTKVNDPGNAVTAPANVTGA
jgi:hypothetical protein